MRIPLHEDRRRLEQDRPAVRGDRRDDRELIDLLEKAFRGDPGQVPAVNIHRVDVAPGAVSEGREDDRSPVARDRRRPIVLRVLGQVADARAVAIHDVHISLPVALGLEHHPLTVGRRGGEKVVFGGSR